MKSILWRNFLVYSAVVLIVFGLFAGCFIFQLDRYSSAEKQRQLEYSAQRISQMTAVFLDNYYGAVEMVYKFNLSQVAADNKVYAIVCNTNGNIAYFANDTGDFIKSDEKISSEILSSVLSGNTYSGRGTADSIFKKNMRIAAVPIISKSGEIFGAVLTASPANTNVRLLSNINKMFGIVILLSIIITLIVSYIVTGWLTKPLKNIATAAKRYSDGDFSVRLEAESCREDEIGALAESFNNMAASLDHIEQQRRTFIANISHDLKTPMTTVSGFVDGILDGTIPPERQREYLAVISDEIKRLARLAETMLEMSKLEAGNVIPSFTKFDVCDLTSRVILSFEQAVNKKHADVEFDAPPSLIISADIDMIFRVIYNLTDNAVKFLSDNGKLRIKISLSANRLDFMISNTGPKIPEEDIPFIFDRFYKVDRSRGINKKGSGLGLYIVKSTVNLHKGSVFVESNDTETTFGFNIPVNG